MANLTLFNIGKRYFLAQKAEIRKIKSQGVVPQAVGSVNLRLNADNTTEASSIMLGNATFFEISATAAKGIIAQFGLVLNSANIATQAIEGA